MLVLLAALAAYATPMELTQTGRLLDSAGLPLNGSNSVTFNIHLSTTSSSPLWSETQQLTLEDGYYSAILGADSVANALPDTLFDGSIRYLGIAVNGGTELPDRIQIVSVPYAIRAGSLAAGTVVDASEIRIGGNTVIDGSGNLTSGPTLGDLTCAADQVAVFDGSDWGCGSASSGSTSFDDLTDVPTDLSDGDDDSLGDLICSDQSIARWNSTAARWECSLDIDTDTDTTLDEAAVDAFVANNGYITATLTEAEVDAFVANNGYVTDWTDLPSIPSDIADGDDDTQLDEAAVDAFVANNGYITATLSEGDVETFITNGPLDFAPGTTIGGIAPVTTDVGYGLANLVGNGGFDIWQRGTSAMPDLWYASGTVSYAQGGSGNTFVTATGSAAGDLVFQKLETPENWAGVPLTFSVDVLSGAGSVEIDDGVTVTNVPFTGAGRISVNHTVDASPTRLSVNVVVDDQVVEFDNAMLVSGTWGDAAFTPTPRADDWQRAQRFYEIGRSAMYSDDGAENPGDAWAWEFRTVKSSAPAVSWSYYAVNGNTGNYSSAGPRNITARGFNFDLENNDAEAGGAFYYKILLDWTADVAVTY